MSNRRPNPRQPEVSVLLSVYNGRPYLRESVDSILSQSLEDLELLVIDDGSTDGSLEVIQDIRDSRLRTLSQENTGKSAALNRAMRETSGTFFAIQDADDWSHPDRLKLQVKALEEDPEIAGVFCGHQLIMDEKRVAPRRRAMSKEECRRATDRLTMPAHDPTALYRRSLVGNIPFDPKAGVADGLDFILKVSEQHPLIAIDSCLYGYRIHFNSVTRDNIEKRTRCVRYVIEQACLRRGMKIESADDFIAKPAQLGKKRMLDNNLPAHFMESVIDSREHGQWLEAIRSGIRCSSLHPFDLHYHKALIYSLVPRALIRKFRRQLKHSESLVTPS